MGCLIDSSKELGSSDFRRSGDRRTEYRTYSFVRAVHAVQFEGEVVITSGDGLGKLEVSFAGIGMNVPETARLAAMADEVHVGIVRKCGEAARIANTVPLCLGKNCSNSQR